MLSLPRSGIYISMQRRQLFFQVPPLLADLQLANTLLKYPADVATC